MFIRDRALAGPLAGLRAEVLALCAQGLTGPKPDGLARDVTGGGRAIDRGTGRDMLRPGRPSRAGDAPAYWLGPASSYSPQGCLWPPRRPGGPGASVWAAPSAAALGP